MTKKQRTAAVITIRDAETMSTKGRKLVAAWMRRQAAFFEKDGRAYSRRFTARYICHAAALLAAMLVVGCGRIGSETLFERDKSTITNGSPVTLNIQDNDKIGTVSGTGPARYTSLDNKGLQTIQSGTVPRDAVLQLPDGARFVLSSGTDLNIENVTFNPESKAVSIGKLSTLTSEPLRAHNEALDRLVAYWQGRDQATKERDLAAIETIRSTAPELFTVIRAALGVP